MFKVNAHSEDFLNRMKKELFVLENVVHETINNERGTLGLSVYDILTKAVEKSIISLYKDYIELIGYDKKKVFLSDLSCRLVIEIHDLIHLPYAHNLVKKVFPKYKYELKAIFSSGGKGIAIYEDIDAFENGMRGIEI